MPDTTLAHPMPIADRRSSVPRRRPVPAPEKAKPAAGILQRTIRRDRDPAWPCIDRLAIELHAAALRRVYVRELLTSLRESIAVLADALR